MSEVAGLMVRGPVRTCRHELSEWDPATLVAQLFADRTFASVAYTYDDKGRVVEKTMRTGALSEERTTSRYDDRDDSIDEISEHHSRSAGMDGDGVVQTTEEAPRTHYTRFDYQYDDHGNWTERIVWSRIDERAEFLRSNVIRRTITYYGAGAPPVRS